MTTNNTDKVFDYRGLRLLMGVIAFALPFVVWFLSSSLLSSISASYYTEARDAFVGMLFVISAFLWAYNGHSSNEAVASKVASLAAVCVALFPTVCDTCKSGTTSTIHYIAAAILFSVLAYFCFVYFRKNTKGKEGKKGVRSKVYFICGWVMVACMLCIVYVNFALSEEEIKSSDIIFWAEAIALGAFGAAWIVAGKYFRLLVDEGEAL